VPSPVPPPGQVPVPPPGQVPVPPPGQVPVPPPGQVPAPPPVLAPPPGPPSLPTLVRRLAAGPALPPLPPLHPWLLLASVYEVWLRWQAQWTAAPRRGVRRAAQQESEVAPPPRLDAAVKLGWAAAVAVAVQPVHVAAAVVAAAAVAQKVCSVGT